MSEIDFLIGCDLGQMADYSAVCVLAVPVWVPQTPAADTWAMWPTDEALRGWVSPLKLEPSRLQYFRQHNESYGRPPHPPLDVIHLERFPLGTKYPRIVDAVRALVMDTPLRLGSRQLLCDSTGVGRPLVDMFDQAGLSPLAITVTAGSAITPEPDRTGFHVAKTQLIGATVAVVESRRLRVSPALAEAQTLVSELQTFQRRINPASVTESFGAWRTNQHDDLLFSLALTVWYREWSNAPWDARMAERERAGIVAAYA